MSNLQRPVNVAGGARPHAETLRQLIEFAWKALAEDCTSPNGYLVEECFAFWGQEVIDAVKKFIVEHQNMAVSLQWPKQGQNIPLISVISVSENEDASRDVLGDQMGITARGIAKTTDTNGVPIEVADNNIVQRYQLGMAVKCVTEIYVRTADPTLTVLVAYLVRLIIFINKDQLIEDADLHNLTMDIGKVEDGLVALFPEFALDRVVRCAYDTHFEYNLREQVVRRLNFSILVNMAQIEPVDGNLHDERAVPVPYSKP